VAIIPRTSCDMKFSDEAFFCPNEAVTFSLHKPVILCLTALVGSIVSDFGWLCHQKFYIRVVGRQRPSSG
jgi:hypothetical protein